MTPQFNSPLTTELNELLFGFIIPKMKENKPGKLDMVGNLIHGFINSVALPMLPNAIEKFDQAPELQKLVWEQFEQRYWTLKPQMEEYLGKESDCRGCGDDFDGELDTGEFTAEDVRTGADISEETNAYPRDSGHSF